ncbi:MAG: MCE family protein [Pseudomonadota bacterium]|nr:MAG: MCE family protein [Pseudomonadota bacterium]
MKHENVNYLVVGSFVLGMLALLLVVLYQITGRTGQTAPYFVSLPNVSGIKSGTTVTYSGFVIGEVERILADRSDDSTTYKIELAIRADWRIPDDSIARIVRPGILTEPQLDILEGKSGNYLAPGATIEGETGGNLMAGLSKLADELHPLIANLGSLVTDVDNVVDEALPPIADNATALLVDLRATAAQLRGIVEGRNRDRIDAILGNADVTMRNLAELSTELEGAGAQLKTVLNESGDLLSDDQGDLRQSVAQLRNTLESVAQSIDSIVYNLDTASRNMNEFSRQIRDNPGALLSGKPPADKGVQ